MVLSINHPSCTPNSCRRIGKIPALDDPRLGRALPTAGQNQPWIHLDDFKQILTVFRRPYPHDDVGIKIYKMNHIQSWPGFVLDYPDASGSAWDID